MNIEELRERCLNLKGVEEGFPFDEETLVFKVMGKMFCLAGLENNPVQFNVKCDPEKAIELREEYSGVRPGYHMSKKHWNTVVFDGSVTDEQAWEWVLHSYELVVQSLPKKVQEQMKNVS